LIRQNYLKVLPPEDEERATSLAAELFRTIKEYSEYSTIAGIVYLFMAKQTLLGKIYWTITIILMLALSFYW
jgi:hypothetical protein